MYPRRKWLWIDDYEWFKGEMTIDWLFDYYGCIQGKNDKKILYTSCWLPDSVRKSFIKLEKSHLVFRLGPCSC